jgi:hypothetical protein
MIFLLHLLNLVGINLMETNGPLVGFVCLVMYDEYVMVAHIFLFLTPFGEVVHDFFYMDEFKKNRELTSDTLVETYKRFGKTLQEVQ